MFWSVTVTNNRVSENQVKNLMLTTTSSRKITSQFLPCEISIWNRDLKNVEMCHCEEERRLFQVILTFNSMGTCSDQKKETRVPALSRFYKFVSKPDVDWIIIEYAYHPYLFHQLKPNLLQQRLEECRIPWKNLKQISFSLKLIKLSTQKYLM